MSSPRPLWLIAAPAFSCCFGRRALPSPRSGLQHAEPLTLLALRYVILVVLLLPLAVILRVPMPATARAGPMWPLSGF